MSLTRAARYGYLSARCRTIRSRLLDRAALQELAATRSVGELFAALAVTPYGPYLSAVSAEGIHTALADAFVSRRDSVTRALGKGDRELVRLFFDAKYRLLDEKFAQAQSAHPEEAFRRIDREYLSTLERGIRRVPGPEQRHLRRMIGSYCDLLNLYNLVKLRLLYRRSIEETLAFMLPGGEALSMEGLASLCLVEGLSQLSDRVEPLLGEGFGDYESFRKALYRYHRRHLDAVWSGYPFSIAHPFALLRLLEIETADLRAITEGIAAGLESGEIIAMTVGV